MHSMLKPYLVDAVNTSWCIRRSFTLFRVVLRPQMRCFRRSAQFLWRVRFSAAPLKTTRRIDRRYRTRWLTGGDTILT